jgi:hypothetical protein
MIQTVAYQRPQRNLKDHGSLFGAKSVRIGVMRCDWKSKSRNVASADFFKMLNRQSPAKGGINDQVVRLSRRRNAALGGIRSRGARGYSRSQQKIIKPAGWRLAAAGLIAKTDFCDPLALNHFANPLRTPNSR